MRLEGARAAAITNAAEFQAVTGVSRETAARLEIYAATLARWQTAINLVGRGTLETVWQRHLLDSAQLLAHLPEPSAPLVDLGSGAGFPGLVLAILGAPDVHLIEADARKAAFLAETARLTDTKITLHRRRIEDVPGFPAAVVTARALAPLTALLGLARRFFGPTTVGLFHKGRDWQRELTLAEEAWTMDLRCLPSVADPDSIIMRIAALRPAGSDVGAG
jgi:16S rRNA (guanine(527)-N(7))-methyltransferase RsmG